MKERVTLDKRLEELQKQYESVKIPDTLDSLVTQTISQHRAKKVSLWKKWGMASAAAVTLLTVGLNISPVMAKSLAGLPVLGEVVEVLTWKTYTVDHGNMTAEIDVPAIQSEKQQGVAAELNEKYKEEAAALYDQFVHEMKAMEQAGVNGHYGIYSDYDVITDTQQLLTIRRTITETAASAYETNKYDTIDKTNEVLITLPSLFKNDQYMATISHYIMEQMQSEMRETDMNSIYWVEGAGIPNEELTERFTTIKPDQSFFINASGKLVIAFDEYEVAPGYMGTPTFEIPSELLTDLLVSNAYIH